MWNYLKLSLLKTIAHLSFYHHLTQTRHISIVHTWAQTEITVQMYPWTTAVSSALSDSSMCDLNDGKFTVCDYFCSDSLSWATL